jgi:hypothetical protein
MEGKACGVVRKCLEGKCPHKAGSKIVFTTKFLPWMDGDQSVPFAKATVVSVRPGTVGGFRRDRMLAGQDGFANGEVWHGHLNQFYGGICNSDSVYHITFRIDEIDKKAGLKKSRD